MSYLLDTNVLSEPLRARPNPGVMRKLEAHADALAIASVTWQELLYGMLSLPAGQRRDGIRDYLFHRLLPTLPILAFDVAAARWQAEERARLRHLGKPPSYPDSQIAAIAAVNNRTLVTRNIQDFASFQDLRLENWFSEDADPSAPGPHV